MPNEADTQTQMQASDANAWQTERAQIIAEKEAAEAKLAAYAAEAKRLEGEQRKQAEDAGSSKALADELAAARAQAQANEADAALGRTYREQEQAKIDAAAKEMPAEWRQLLDVMPASDVRARAMVVERYRAATAKQATPPPPGQVAPPVQQHVVDVDAMLARGMSIEQIKGEHAKEWGEYLARKIAPKKQTGGIASWFAAKKVGA